MDEKDRALIKYLETIYDVEVWTSNEGGDVYVEGFAIIIRPKVIE